MSTVLVHFLTRIPLSLTCAHKHRRKPVPHSSARTLFKPALSCVATVMRCVCRSNFEDESRPSSTRLGAQKVSNFGAHRTAHSTQPNPNAESVAYVHKRNMRMTRVWGGARWLGWPKNVNGQKSIPLKPSRKQFSRRNFPKKCLEVKQDRYFWWKLSYFEILYRYFQNYYFFYYFLIFLWSILRSVIYEVVGELKYSLMAGFLI